MVGEGLAHPEKNLLLIHHSVVPLLPQEKAIIRKTLPKEYKE